MIYKKTIWLDLRFLKKNDIYSKFITKLINLVIEKDETYLYNIYLNDSSYYEYEFKNTKIIKIDLKPWSFRDQLFFTKKIKNIKWKDDENFFIFFNHKVPSNITKDYIVFIPELTKLHFSENINFLERKFRDYLFYSSCNKAKKVVCFNDEVKEEINDKLNIKEEKIVIIPAFIDNYEKKDKKEEIKINIKAKYNIESEFIIYDSWIEPEKNLFKLIDLFLEIKNNNIDLSLLILNEETIKDINFRKKVLEENLTNKIFFIWNTNDFETSYFYENTLWVIFPFLYNVFPFEMERALNYNSNILSSNLKSIKNFFWDDIQYFNPNNISSIYEKVIKIKKKKNNYKDIFEKNKIDNTYNSLKKLIESL